MKNIANQDLTNLNDQFIARETMQKRNQRKLPYDRVSLIAENGKFSSKQSDRSREISQARRLCNKAKADALNAIIEEENRVFVEEFFSAD